MHEAGLGTSAAGSLRGSEAERTVVTLKRETTELGRALEEATQASHAAEASAAELRSQLEHIESLQDDSVRG